MTLMSGKRERWKEGDSCILRSKSRNLFQKPLPVVKNQKPVRIWNPSNRRLKKINARTLKGIAFGSKRHSSLKGSSEKVGKWRMECKMHDRTELNVFLWIQPFIFHSYLRFHMKWQSMPLWLVQTITIAYLCQSSSKALLNPHLFFIVLVFQRWIFTPHWTRSMLSSQWWPFLFLIHRPVQMRTSLSCLAWSEKRTLNL